MSSRTPQRRKTRIKAARPRARFSSLVFGGEDHSSGTGLWSNNTKLVVSLSLIALLAWLINKFRNIVGVLLLAFLLAYLLYPVSDWLRKHLRIPWRGAATIVFVLSLLSVIGLLTWGGYALVNQVQALINFIQSALTRGLPDFLLGLPEFTIGTFHFPPASDKDLASISQELLSLINPVLSSTTNLLTSLVSGAATFLGWTFLTLLISYFIMAESGGVQGQMLRINLPGLGDDTRRFGQYLRGIWNAFLRGQITIILITVAVYALILSVLGIRYALGLAILAGMARFVPYVGPAVAWTTYGLVAFFLGSSWINLPPLGLVLLVVGFAWLTDLIIDNMVAVRVMGEALKIHPAIVTISVLIAANLLGFIGVILAAPVAATLKLFLEYVISKLFDRDPWAGMHTETPLLNRSAFNFLEYHWQRFRQRFILFWQQNRGPGIRRN